MIVKRPDRSKYYGQHYAKLVADLELYIDHLEGKLLETQVKSKSPFVFPHDLPNEPIKK